MKFVFPSTNMNYTDFLKNVKTGDLLLTRASNNIMSNLHSRFLYSPVSHVGLAVVSPCKDVLFFEAGPRGAQLRGVLDYMKDGADHLWWRPLKDRPDVFPNIEKFAKSAYSFGFLHDLPRELLGIDSPGHKSDAEFMANSCGDLVARVYEHAGILTPSHRRWLPMNFLDDASMPWITRLGEPVSIIINNSEFSEYDCMKDALVSTIMSI